MTDRKFWLRLLDTCRGWATFILTENGAVLLAEESVQCCILTTKFCMTGDIKQDKQPNFFYFKKKSEEPPIDPKMAEDNPFSPDDPQPRHSSCQ
jgi:hypothetical protein